MTRTSRPFIYFCASLVLGLTFTFLPLTWASEALFSQQARLLAADVQVIDHTGYSVAIEGNTAVVGDFNTNAAEVYEFDGSRWMQQQKITTAQTVAQLKHHIMSASQTRIGGLTKHNQFVSIPIPVSSLSTEGNVKPALWLDRCLNSIHCSQCSEIRPRR